MYFCHGSRAIELDADCGSSVFDGEGDAARGMPAPKSLNVYDVLRSAVLGFRSDANGEADALAAEDSTS